MPFPLASSPRSKPARPKLDRATIIAEALAQLDAEGFESLSLRRLASRLRVQAPALYWHFTDRADLLAAMVEELQARVPVAPIPMSRANVAGWIIERGSALRVVLLAVRDSARLLAAATVSSRMNIAFSEMLREIDGLSKVEVTRVTAILNSYVLGWVHYQQQPEMFDFLTDILDLDATFASGLRALARGIIEELDPQS